MPKSNMPRWPIFPEKGEDAKPITQFFSFLDTTTGLLKTVATKYIKISDNAWRAFLALVFILLLWVSGDLQNAMFVLTIILLSILIGVDIAIDNWGKIFRTFRREKTFDEIDTSNPTPIIQVLSRYNVVGKDMITLLKFLKTKSWITPKMVDTILTQQHLDEYAVDELLTSSLTKRDLLRVLKEYRNAASEDALESVLKKWNYALDVMEVCLLYQIASLELIREKQNIPRAEYKVIEDHCPLQPFHEHWLHKPVQVFFLLFGVATAYQLFLQHQRESFQTLDLLVGTGDSVGVLVLSNLIISVLIAGTIWGLTYILIHPILASFYTKIQLWNFHRVAKKALH